MATAAELLSSEAELPMELPKATEELPVEPPRRPCARPSSVTEAAELPRGVAMAARRLSCEVALPMELPRRPSLGVLLTAE